MKIKKLVVFLVICMMLIPMVTSCNKNVGKNNNNNNTNKQANTNEGITKDKTVGDLIITKTSLVYENGTSVLTTQVKNGSTKDVYVGGLDIVFKDSTGKVIVTALGYIGATIPAGGSRNLVTNIDQNLMNATTVDYSLRSK